MAEKSAAAISFYKSATKSARCTKVKRLLHHPRRLRYSYKIGSYFAPKNAKRSASQTKSASFLICYGGMTIAESSWVNWMDSAENRRRIVSVCKKFSSNTCPLPHCFRRKKTKRFSASSFSRCRRSFEGERRHFIFLLTLTGCPADRRTGDIGSGRSWKGCRNRLPAPYPYR